VEGLFTLWFYPPDAKDKDTEKLLCQIPAGFLGEKFMLSTSFSGGGFFTGFPIDERVVRWELLDKQLLLIQPETLFVADTNNPVSDVVRRTYPDRIRAAVPIVTKSPAGDPVIDLGGLLKSNFADISWMSIGFGPGMGAGGINPSLSKWTKKKSFELNVEIGVELAMSSMFPSGSYEKKAVHYSFWKLPQSDYAPRVADDRVGYFLTTNQDWAKPTEARELFNRYINRWHLVKRDPSLPLCEPRQPIVFYIEKTVPIRFRRAVRDGILEWNKAFEKVGFLHAVEVRQQTDDNEWKDLDPEDMRYSFFRWIVTGAGFAMGPSRPNPFTGQIYDADIIFDDSMVRYFEQSAQQMLPSSAVAVKTQDLAVGAFLEKFPQWKRPQREWETFAFGRGHEEQLREAVRKRMRERGQHGCEYAHGMRHQMAMSQAMLAGQPPEVIDRFLYDVIKEVVMHEVGHTLGLRHNFKASSIYSMEEIEKRRDTGEPTTGSVMDYNPVLFFKDKATEGHFLTPTLGPYDVWAIEYGYRPFDGSSLAGDDDDSEKDEDGDEDKKAESGKASVEGSGGSEPDAAKSALEGLPKEVRDQIPPEVLKMIESGQAGAVMKMAGAAAGKADVPGFKAPPSGEEGMLRQIAARAAEPELAYATDEDCTLLSPDPRVNRFDAAASPVDWARTRLDLVDKRMENILEWAVKDSESWYFLRNAFAGLAFEKALVQGYVGRYVGGQYFNRSHRGDPKGPPPFVLVDAKLQREALEFMEENLFSDKCFTFCPEVLNHLAPSRWWHADSDVSFSMDFPIHDMISVLQWYNLFDLLLPNTLRRIHDAELKSTEDSKLTVAEFLQRVQKACWSHALDADRLSKGKFTDSAPYSSDIGRSLQREYLGLMEPLVRTTPGSLLSPDLHAMVRYSLESLRNEIQEVLGSEGIDFASQAHLTACKSRIERMLAPELREYTSFGMSMGF
jgi:hypothetical protein